MAYSPDLAPCTYYSDPDDPEDPWPRLLAVGWLDRSHPYTKGDPGKQVYTRLKQLAQIKWQPVLFLGGHRCEFCRYDGFISHNDLFIPGEGITYAVPEAIVLAGFQPLRLNVRLPALPAGVALIAVVF